VTQAVLSPRVGMGGNQDPPIVYWTIVCILPFCFTGALLHGFLTDEDPHHSLYAYVRHRTGARDVPNVKTHHEMSRIYFEKMPKQFALFLYNSTMPHHLEFMHDVRVANWRHDIGIFKHDCTKPPGSLCAERGHGNVHEYEPPILFYHGHEWSESFHDDIQTGKVSKPTTRRQRVNAVLRWLDQAAPSAEQKLFDRENYFARMRAEGSPTQRMMREMEKKVAKEAKEKEKQAQEAEQDGTKIEL